ncbi:Panacea domain-containing protein [Bacteroidota bacterium]
MILNKFSVEKATNALNFFVIKSGGEINKLKALKLVYFADRYHLRKYGKLITNDTYLAMKHGPVGSATKNICEFSDYTDEFSIRYAGNFIELKDEYTVHSKKEIDKSVLSKSDIEALNFAWKVYGAYDHFELRDITHEYKEWIKASVRLTDDIKNTPMDIMDFLLDPNGEYNKCFELSAEDKIDLREEIEEWNKIQAFWS